MSNVISRQVISSVGIDIGTTTTNVIFSQLTVENRASNFTVPRISIVDKQVVYKSDIYFTPLLSPTEINTEEIKKIVSEEYRKAGMTPHMVHSGAVIITGDMARKKNANQVLKALSDSSGDFVVAIAGPGLESVLSARGAGTDVASKEKRCVMANLDIGGGTTNIAVYDKGRLAGVTCIDIGGRLIRVEKGRIVSVFPKIRQLASENGISINAGNAADEGLLRRTVSIMADVLSQSIGLAPAEKSIDYIYTNNGKGLHDIPKIEALTFSGGVADCIYNGSQTSGDVYRYGDIGVLLGEAVRNNKYFKQVQTIVPAETIRATVVGAGVHTTEISGSTILFTQGLLPIKNIPILNIGKTEESSSEKIIASIRSQIPLYKPEGKLEQIAIAFAGYNYSTFSDIQYLANAIAVGAEEVINGQYPLILVVEHDIGKALGHALNVRLNHKKPMVCIDGIKALSGDYIDIGEPVCGGHVLPVVIKTLIFNS
mgnify:FL=1